jgi:hypothetical protein
MRMSTWATAAGLALLATAALAKSVAYDYDRRADFTKYRTWAWTRGTELTDEFNHARVVRAVEAQLAARGLNRVEPGAGPDLLVAYHASFEKSLEIRGSVHGWGPLGLGLDRTGSARIEPVVVGTLVVDVIDVRTNAIVWRAVASSDIDPKTSPRKRDEKIDKTTEKMFRNYPPRP